MAGGDTRRPFHLEEKWLVDALVAGTVKSVGSSFGIGLGASPPVPMLMVLISGQLQKSAWRNAFGRNCHSDSWVRLAGCSRWGGSRQPISPVPSASASTHGMKIHSMSTTTPFAQPDEDWMGWLPYFHYRPVGADLRSEITWNAEASPYAVDIKAQRKLEELNQTLWMFFTSPGEGVITYNWDLSIGLKLP